MTEQPAEQSPEQSTGIVWSNTDYPYLCLVDRERTLGFRTAIEAAVRPGDVVVEVGAGTGILSLFAAAAGAARVVAVEIDPVLARCLRATVAANGLEDVVEVLEADALVADLPQDADVCIAELVETGLLDEMQVSVMNRLRSSGVVTDRTRLVLESYVTSLQLVTTDQQHYGFTVLAPKHEWPYYRRDAQQWEHLRWRAVSDVVTLSAVDFTAGLVDPVVDTTVRLQVPAGERADAFVLSGAAGMHGGSVLGACNSFSGDKVIALPPCTGEVSLRVRYTMGHGLDDLSVELV